MGGTPLTGVQRDITLTVDAADCEAARQAGEAELVSRLGSQLEDTPLLISAIRRL